MKSLRLLVVLAGLAFFYFSRTVMVPIVLSLFLFFLIDPLVVWSEKKGVLRGLSAPFFILLSVGLFSVGGWLTYEISSQIVKQIPQYSEKVKKIVSPFMEKTQELAQGTQQLLSSNESERVQKVEVVSSYGSWTGVLIKGLDSIFGTLGGLLVVPFLALLLLIEKPSSQKRIEVLIPSAEKRRLISSQMSQVIVSFFLGNMVIGIGSAAVFFAVFLSIDLSNKLALAFGAGFLILVPIVGPFVAAVFPIAQALLQYNSASPFIIILATSLLIHFVIGNFLMPKVIGSKIDLNVIAASVGLLFWGWLWGPMGIFLAIPLTATVKIICFNGTKTKPFASLLSDSEEKERPFERFREKPILLQPKRS